MPSVYYAVCPGTGGTDDKKTGSPTITIASGVATLSVAQTGNIGQGFRITYDTSKVCFISKVNSSTSFNVVTATGGTPSNEASAVTVNSIAADYASLSAAEDGASDSSHLNTSDLVTANTILNLVCYAGASADTTACTIDGYTTDSTRYVKIFTPRGLDFNESIYSQRHAGVWDDNKYIITHTNASWGIINNSQSYTVIEGIQVSNPYTGTSTNRYAIGSATSTDYINVTVRDCIVRATGTGSFTKGIYLMGRSNQVINCIAYDFALEGIYASNDTTSAGSCYIMNCTAYNCGYGICSSSANYRSYKTYAYNCASFGCGSSDYRNPAGNWHASSSNNASEDGTAPGTDIDLSGYTASAIWTDADNGDFSLVSGSPLIGEGTDLSAYFTTDIKGTTRSSWDIGAFEYVAPAAAGGIIPIIMNHLQKMRAN